MDGIYLADQDTDGWETVQRGGRLKNKSNSRSSLQKDSLTQSSESVHKSRHSSNSSEPFRRNTSRDEPMSPEVVPDRIPLPHSEQSRNRTSSRDSEKENVPIKAEQSKTGETTPKKSAVLLTNSPRTQAKTTSPKQQRRYLI